MDRRRNQSREALRALEKKCDSGTLPAFGAALVAVTGRGIALRRAPPHHNTTPPSVLVRPPNDRPQNNQSGSILAPFSASCRTRRPCTWRTRVRRREKRAAAPPCALACRRQLIATPAPLAVPLYPRTDMKAMEAQSASMHEDVKQRVMRLREVQGKALSGGVPAASTATALRPRHMNTCF